jgi:hypothetical protein
VFFTPAGGVDTYRLAQGITDHLRHEDDARVDVVESAVILAGEFVPAEILG